VLTFAESPLTAPARGGRQRRLSTALLLVAACAVALILVLRHANQRSDNPASEGYTKVGTVDGTTFWLQVDRSTAALRTTGKLAALCNNREDLRSNEPTPVCTHSDTQTGSGFVFLADAAVHHVRLTDTDGDALTETGRLSASPAAPGKVLLVVLVPGRAVNMVKAPEFS